MSTIVFPANDNGREKPRLGWRNLFTDSDAVVTSSEADQSGYEHQNAYDWKTSSSWAFAGQDVYLTAVFSTTKFVNYFAYYGQTIYLLGGQICLEYNQGGAGWVQASDWVMPADNKAGYINMDGAMADSWRVHINFPSVPAQNYFLSCVAFGEDMPLELGQWVGFAPPEFSQEQEASTSLSDTGSFLGRSIIRKGWTCTLDQDFITESWMRTLFLPFLEAFPNQAMFLQWNPTEQPDKVIYCWSDEKVLQPAKYSSYGLMKHSMKLRGLMS